MPAIRSSVKHDLRIVCPPRRLERYKNKLSFGAAKIADRAGRKPRLGPAGSAQMDKALSASRPHPGYSGGRTAWIGVCHLATIP